MNLKEFKQLLALHPDHELVVQFESGQHIGAHFHVTEIGKVTKDFVDCGGTRQTTVSCVLQTLVANDIDHRLKSDKLAMIVEKAGVLDLEESLPVELEIQTDTIGVYSIASGQLKNERLVIELAAKQTACLAPDKCGLEELPVASTSECGDESAC